MMHCTKIFIWRLAGACLALFNLQALATANIPPSTRPVLVVSGASDIVVKARLQSFVPDKRYHISSFSSQLDTWPAGLYTFETLQNFKGNSAPTFSVGLPQLLTYYYALSNFSMGKGNIALVFLKRDAEGQLIPTEATLPMLRLSDAQIGASANSELGLDNTIINLLLDSLQDKKLRWLNTNFLRSISSPKVVLGLASYLDDENLFVRDNVLYCMAINQQVAAIPRIVQLSHELRDKKRGSLRAVNALFKFSSPEAVPYLNPLLFETPSGFRFAAAHALSQVGDQSSVPHFLLALYDPEPQKVVGQYAYVSLHKLLPDLPPAQGNEYFYSHQKEETTLLWNTWRDKLSGKHLPAKTENAPATRPRLPDLTKLKPEQALPLVHPLLFEPTLKTRQEAMTILEKIADRSSIPYLLIAVQDPDTDIAYAAYKKLFRLIDGLGLGQIRQNFEADREAATKPLYDWWKDELLGKHLPKPVVSSTKP